ncbi:MAG: prolyl-tRNA synthetase associated domain-containing protein [Bacteroidales bacterium]|nr:prolyl-tRNA synthetase associated domain-containing protein [Bacteroidales bacterium]
MDITSIQISNIITTPPERFSNPLQEKVYQTLSTLGTAIERVDNSPAASMEDCHAIGSKLKAEVVKNIFLCNRQQTVFYLFITRSDKPFSTKDFGKALQISRVSFAPADKLMEMMGAEHGATSVFCLLMDSEHKVRYIIDKDVLDNLEFIGCPDGTLTSYMKIPTDHLLKIAELSGHSPTIIEV